MYLGRIVEIADGRELFRNPRMPYTRMLLDAVPDLAMSGRQRMPVQGEIPNPIDPPPGCTFNPRCPLAFDLLPQGGARADRRRRLPCRQRSGARRGAGMITAMGAAMRSGGWQAVPRCGQVRSTLRPPQRWIPMSNINPDPFTTRPEIEGTFGVVTSTHWIATAVGMGMLEKGGNAFDAGVATAFTLQVVEPHLNGPGGDVPIIVHDVKRGRTEVICGQGPAPAGATIAHYRSEGLDMVPGTGLLAACVPGTFESWMLLLRDYGTMRLRDVLEPAIAYARDGYPLVERAAATIQIVENMFRNALEDIGRGLSAQQRGAEARHTVHQQDAVGNLCPHPEGSRKRRQRPRRADRSGAARVVEGFCRRSDRQILPHAGRHGRQRLAASRRAAADDMARWQPTVEAPLTYDYGRYTVCKPGVWSQGPVMLQQLALLKGFELDGLDPAGPEFIHLRIEAQSSPSPTARSFMAIPTSARSRSRRCCRTPTMTSAAS